jgi:hypothetical protein
MLSSINEALRDENDKLHVELEKYRKYRLPKSTSQTGEDDRIIRPTQRHKSDEGSDIDGARVCKRLDNFSLFVYDVLNLSLFIISPT